MDRRTISLLIALVVSSAACADEKPGIDAELARDLELATAQPADPQLADVPLDAPEPAPAPPVTAPARRTAPPPARSAPPPRPRSATVTRQPTTTESPAPVAESPEPRAESRSRGILAGTSFGLTTRGQVCTNNRPGDKIVATVTEPVVGQDGATIPAGSSVVLEVVSVAPGDTPESADIALRVRSIVLDGVAHPVDAAVAISSELARGPATENNSDKKKVVGGAIAGAVIGQIMGRDTRSTVIGAAAGAAAGTAAAAATRKYHACLPAGSSARVTTTQPIIL